MYSLLNVKANCIALYDCVQVVCTSFLEPAIVCTPLMSVLLVYSCDLVDFYIGKKTM